MQYKTHPSKFQKSFGENAKKNQTQNAQSAYETFGFPRSLTRQRKTMNFQHECETPPNPKQLKNQKIAVQN